MNGTSDVAVSFDVPAPMRDGVVLRADVYRPQGAGPLPTILVRTPYGKGTKETMEMVGPIKAAQQGFLVVIQDVRGRGASDGGWKPFHGGEAADGHDSIEWAASLPESNGSVGTLGDSYTGWNQWAAATTRPKALKAIAPMDTWCDWANGLYFRGGVIELGIQLAWSTFTGMGYLERQPIEPEEMMGRLMAAVDELDNLADRGYWELPVPDAAVLNRLGVPVTEALTGETPPDELRVAGKHAGIDLPSLSIGGWFDIFLQGTLDNFTEMAKRDTGARLMVGPWTHENFMDPIGEGEFGLMAGRFEAPTTEFGDVLDYQREFIRAYTDPEATPAFQTKPVRYFTMGVNEWREADTWPPPGFEDKSHYLHADGTLSTAPAAADEQALEFDYDPADPVPTCGGSTMMAFRYRAGSADQTSIEQRDDVLVFTSAPLEQEQEVTGRVIAVLNAKSSAPTTDWVVRLCDVHPDGRSMNVCDGILRAATEGGEVTRYEVDLWSTSHVFRPGHRIRADVTSSSFPRWERNHNTGDQTSAELVVAHQTLSLDSEHPSYISLPVPAGA